MPNLAANVHHFAFEVEGVDVEFHVLDFSGTEAISQLFSYEITLVTEEDGVNITDLIGKPAVLSFLSSEGNDVIRYLNGMINRVELVGVGRRYTHYMFEVVPTHWMLTNRNNSRIFQDKTVSEIIENVLKEANVPTDHYSFSLQTSYEVKDYCVQYQETDIAFILRLMEEEGIFFFFEHDKNSHVMVIADNVAAHRNIAGKKEVLYHPPSSLASEGEEFVSQLNYSEQITSGSTTLRDYNFKKPALKLETEKKSKIDQDLEIYSYPALFHTPEKGNVLVNIRLEALQVMKKVATGQSDCRRLIPGCRFTLTEYSRDELNQEYLLVSVSHSAYQPQALEEGASESGSSYSNHFVCIPVSTPFRPIRSTPKPAIEGVQTAIVVGPKGEEIYTDEHGRVKLQFHWDREGESNENSSCWVRVSQLWAGTGWGAMFIPRIGHEVIVDFLEGNPDRPIITGRVYHGINTPPYPLPAEKTKSTIKTNSTPGGGGSNEFRFEDRKDNEEIYIHGQKDWNIVIENDKTQRIGHDEALDVGNDRHKTVGANQSESIGTDKTITVGNNHSENIGKDASITISNDQTVNVGNDMQLSVGSDRTTSIGTNKNESIGKNLSVDIGADNTLKIGGDSAENIGKNLDVSIGKNYTADIGKTTTIESGDKLILKCGSASIVMQKNGNITIKGKNISIKGSGNVIVKGSKISEN